MGYIYRLNDGVNLFKWRNESNVYIPVKKDNPPMFRDISIYIKNENGEGLFGLGKIISNEIYKSSEIPLNKNIDFLVRSFFQVKIHLDYLGMFPLVDYRIMKQFPAYHHKWFQKPLNPYKLYWDYSLSNDINFIFDTFYYEIDTAFSIDMNHWKYYIHFLREKYARNYWKYKLPKEKGRCIECGFKNEIPYFLEIHDTTEVDFYKNYIPISMDKFVVLCPNCHKLIHNKIKKNEK